MPNFVSITCPSLQILGKTQREVFPISGQSLIKENCYNSRTSDDIDVKLRPVTKLDKRNKATSKKIDDDVMSESCNVIVIFLIFGQFGAVWRPDSGHRVCKLFSVTVTFCLTKAENRTKKSNTALSLLL